jgi:hypothetical protein
MVESQISVNASLQWSLQARRLSHAPVHGQDWSGPE